MDTLPDRLRMLIDAVCAGNVAAFSRLTSVKDSTIRAWLGKGDANLTIENLEKICRATGTSADWILFGRGDMRVGKHRRRAEQPASPTVEPKTPPTSFPEILGLAAVFDEGGRPTEDRLAQIVSRGNPNISEEFRASAAKELNRLLSRRHKKP